MIEGMGCVGGVNSSTPAFYETDSPTTIFESRSGITLTTFWRTMAEASQIKCPNCGQTYFVQPEQWAQYVGQTINCTRCGREFTVTAGAPSAPVAPPPIPQQPRPMQAAPMNVGPTSPFAPPTAAYSGAPVPTSGWAIASLIVGIAGFCVPLICGVFAVIAGFVGLSQVKQGRATGRGLA